MRTLLMAIADQITLLSTAISRSLWDVEAKLPSARTITVYACGHLIDTEYTMVEGMVYHCGAPTRTLVKTPAGRTVIGCPKCLVIALAEQGNSMCPDCQPVVLDPSPSKRPKPPKRGVRRKS